MIGAEASRAVALRERALKLDLVTTLFVYFCHQKIGLFTKNFASLAMPMNRVDWNVSVDARSTMQNPLCAR